MGELGDRRGLEGTNIIIVTIFRNLGRLTVKLFLQTIETVEIKTDFKEMK